MEPTRSFPFRSRRAAAAALIAFVGGCAGSRGAEDPVVDPAGAAAGPAGDRVVRRELFDGVDLGGWQVARFAGSGEVGVEDGRLVLGAGERLTGVTWTGAELPRTNYELRFVAARIEGVDFFCGLTFPVGDTHATLVLGGWGGATTGLSNLDGRDASSNETTSYRSYALGRDYAIRLSVEPERIRAWIDDESIVDVATTGRAIGVRPEMVPSLPLGLTAFATRAAIGPIELRHW